jgi:hypothetical protein
MRPFWIWRSDATTTHEIGAQRVTPVMQSIGLRWRGGGWLWQFPLAVEVENQTTGEQRDLPIPDITRTTLWCIYAVTLIVMIAAVARWWRGKRSRKVN